MYGKFYGWSREKTINRKCAQSVNDPGMQLWQQTWSERLKAETRLVKTGK